MAQLFHSRKPKFRLFPLTLLGILLLVVMSSIPFAFASTPNLEVEVSDDVDTVAPGQLLTYRVTVRNTSATVTLSNVVVSNALPTQVTYVKASDGGAHANGVVTWQGLMLSPVTVDYRYVTVRVNSPLAAGTTITDNASAQIVDANTGVGTSPSTAQDTDTVRNVAPVARNNSYFTNEGTALPINLASLVSDNNGAGDTFTIAIITGPTKGTLTDNGNGAYTYTPTAAEIAVAESDSFTYQARDSQGALSNVATISITIQPVNDAPVAVDDTAESILEDNNASIAASTLLANDTDVDTATLTITAVSALSTNGGTVDLSAGTITYRPAANFNGADSFTYDVSDGNSTDTAMVSITVVAVNDAPSFTNAGNQSVAEDAGPQTVAGWATAISAGPTDEENQTLSFQTSNNNNALFSVQPTISSNGTLTYTPGANKSGVATITVVLIDNGGTANGGVDRTTQTFTITVGAVNDAPVANDDTAATQLGTAVNISVLANDTDADGDTLTVVSAQLTTGQPGTVTLNGNIVTYTLPSSYVGTLPIYPTIEYTISDGTATDTGTVTVTVTAVNNPPTAIDHAFTTTEDTKLVVPKDGVLTGARDPEGGILNAFLDPNTTTRPKNGFVTLYTDGSFDYMPAPNFHGTDSFVYGVQDNAGNVSQLKTVTITVVAVNDPPSITQNGNVSVLEDSAAYSAQWITSSNPGPANEGSQTVSWTVTNDNSTLFSVQPAISRNNDGTGTLTFTPATNAFGSAAVTVNVTDSDGGTATNIFTITLAAVNDAPSMTAGGNVTVAEDSAAFSAAWASGMSAGPANENAQVFTFALSNDNTALFATQPAIAANGTLTFTPAANAFGVANVTVVLRDSGGTTNGGVNNTTATFTITVTSVSDAPVANDDQASTTINQPLTIPATTLLLNDIDPDGHLLTISSVSTTSTGRGSVTRSGNDILYTPVSGFVGVDTFTYTITNGQGGSATATVSVTVTAGSQFTMYLPLVTIETTTVVTPPATADLVGSFSVSPAKTSFSTSEQVVVTAQVTNQGNAAAGPFWVDLYINPTTAPSTTNIAWNTTCSLEPCQGIAWYVKDGLAPGQSITLTSTSTSYMTGYTIWSGQFAAGTTDLYLYVDSWNPGVATGGVAESNETNNIAEQHGLVVTGTSTQSLAQGATELPTRPAHPSN